MNSFKDDGYEAAEIIDMLDGLLVYIILKNIGLLSGSSHLGNER